MVRYMEENSELRFKPIPLPDYHPTEDGASVFRSLLTEEFNGKLLGKTFHDVRYPIQGYSAFGTMQVDQVDMEKFTGTFKSVGNFWFSSRRFLGFLMDIMRFGKARIWQMATRSSNDYSISPSTAESNDGIIRQHCVQLSITVR